MHPLTLKVRKSSAGVIMGKAPHPSQGEDPSDKVDLITGITGQDGTYLAEFLLSRGYSFMASSAGLPCSIPTILTILPGVHEAEG